MFGTAFSFPTCLMLSLGPAQTADYNDALFPPHHVPQGESSSAESVQSAAPDCAALPLLPPGAAVHRVVQGPQRRASLPARNGWSSLLRSAASSPVLTGVVGGRRRATSLPHAWCHRRVNGSMFQVSTRFSATMCFLLAHLYAADYRLLDGRRSQTCLVD